MQGIELTIGTVGPEDTIERTAAKVDFLPVGTPVRVLLAESPVDLYGRVVSVQLDTGKRGGVYDGVYEPATEDIAPNLVCYVVREDGTGADFECNPAKVHTA